MQPIRAATPEEDPVDDVMESLLSQVEVEFGERIHVLKLHRQVSPLYDSCISSSEESESAQSESSSDLSSADHRESEYDLTDSDREQTPAEIDIPVESPDVAESIDYDSFYDPSRYVDDDMSSVDDRSMSGHSVNVQPDDLTEQVKRTVQMMLAQVCGDEALSEHSHSHRSRTISDHESTLSAEKQKTPELNEEVSDDDYETGDAMEQSTVEPGCDVGGNVAKTPSPTQVDSVEDDLDCKTERVGAATSDSMADSTATNEPQDGSMDVADSSTSDKPTMDYMDTEDQVVTDTEPCASAEQPSPVITDEKSKEDEETDDSRKQQQSPIADKVADIIQTNSSAPRTSIDYDDHYVETYSAVNPNTAEQQMEDAAVVADVTETLPLPSTSISVSHDIAITAQVATPMEQITTLHSSADEE